MRGYYDCPYSGQSIHAEALDEQIASLIQSLKLTPNWEQDVRKLLHDDQECPDPEVERKGLVRMMIQEVGVDIVAKRILWVKAQPDYEPLFSILDGLRPGAESSYWIKCLEAHEDKCGIEADTRQESTGVEILLQMSHNT